MSFISISIGLIFWILHSISLAVLASSTVTNQNDLISQVINIGSLLTKYYLYVLVIIVVVAFLLPDIWPGKSRSANVFSIVLVPIALILLMVTTNLSNLRVIDADITFKMAEPFTKNGQWDVATVLYKQSLKLAPQEDHYYLFLGRSYLEQAKVTNTTTDQDSLVLEAENDLKVAQSINPLNTDHTANLARLYSWWAGQATTAVTRADRAQQASNYYATAITLSPYSSTLWDEWAVLYMQVINQPQQALDRLNHALSLDPKYSFTQGILGDYYLRLASSASDSTAKQDALNRAAGYYRTAADVYKPTDTISKASYLVSLGNVYTLMAGADPTNVHPEQLQQAIAALKDAIDAGLSSTDLWKVQQAIAKLYLQLGDKADAQYYASLALKTAPSNAQSQIQDLITQTQTSP